MRRRVCRGRRRRYLAGGQPHPRPVTITGVTQASAAISAAKRHVQHIKQVKYAQQCDHMPRAPCSGLSASDLHQLVALGLNQVIRLLAVRVGHLLDVILKRLERILHHEQLHVAK